MKQLVKLWQRPSKNGRSFTYYLIYTDLDGKRKQKSLGHGDKRKAMKQRAAVEAELVRGYIEPDSMRLSQLLDDYLIRTRTQVRQSTLAESERAMKDFLDCIGDIDARKVQHKHGEYFMQAKLDKGNSPATVGKKLRHIKRIFQLAVERRQLDEHPLKYVKQPKVAMKAVRTLSAQECLTLIKAAKEFRQKTKYIQWDLLIQMALCTGMRRGELLNTTWADIDFERKLVEVSPKPETESTWQWHIKDNDRRKLPLTDVLINMLAQLQITAAESNPYVFVPDSRYEIIQSTRQSGNWTIEHGKCPLNNFTRHFQKILSIGELQDFAFHDLRRTCLSRWIERGLSEFEVMTLAGHSKFETTRKFYLSVSSSMIDRARATLDQKSDSVANLLHRPNQG